MKSEKGSVSVGLIVTLAVLGALLVGGFSLYGYLNGLRTKSVQHETGLNAQYLSNQNYLSAFLSGFYEMLGVANLKSDKLDQILTDAVKGRYEDSGGFSANGAFFAAVVEAYPDLAGLDIYDRIVNYVSSQREGYRNIQDKLLDQLRSYDAWREDGFVQSRVIANVLGVPSQRLEARIGMNVVRGAEARDKMYQIVLASAAKKAYETGTMEPLEVPGGNTASPKK